MKKNSAVQLFAWLQEYNQLKSKKEILTSREAYRLEELAERLKTSFHKEESQSSNDSLANIPAFEMEATTPQEQRPFPPPPSQQIISETGPFAPNPDSFSSLPTTLLAQAQATAPSSCDTGDFAMYPKQNQAKPNPSEEDPEASPSETPSRSNWDTFSLFHPPESLKK